MPRKARIVVKNTPHHIVIRGHNNGQVFFEEKDYETYLQDLVTFKKQFKCKVYGYCLLENEVHLIVNPGNDEKSLGLLLKRLGGRYTRYVNKTYDKSGTIWEGRYKSSPIEKETYLLKSELYVDSKAKIKNIVKDSFDYKWSSALIKSGQKMDKQGLIDLSKEFLLLGSNEEEAKKAYFASIFDDLNIDDIAFIENAVQRSQLTGSPGFVDTVEKKTGERIETRGQGRPKKVSSIKKKTGKISKKTKEKITEDVYKITGKEKNKDIVKETAQIKTEAKAETAVKKKSPFSRMAFLSLKQDMLQLRENNSIYTETAYKNLMNSINDIEKTLVSNNIKDGQNLIAALVQNLNLKRGKEFNDNVSVVIADGIAPLISIIASLKG